MKRIWIPQVIAIVMLLWALYPENPYGYYILLRWVCCAAFAFLAFQALARDKTPWVWIFGVTAVVYNPLFRIHLTREIWSVVNLATIFIAAASIFVLTRKPKDKDSNEPAGLPGMASKNGHTHSGDGSGPLKERIGRVERRNKWLVVVVLVIGLTTLAMLVWKCAHPLKSHGPRRPIAPLAPTRRWSP